MFDIHKANRVTSPGNCISNAVSGGTWQRAHSVLWMKLAVCHLAEGHDLLRLSACNSQYQSFSHCYNRENIQVVVVGSSVPVTHIAQRMLPGFEHSGG